MTAEALDKVLSQQDGKAVVRFFKDMSEKDRKLHAPRAIEWLDVSSITNSTDWELQFYLPKGALAAFVARGSQAPKRIQKLLDQLEQAKISAQQMPPQAVQAASIEMARIAVLASANLGDIKKKTAIPLAEHSFAVLLDRKPTWLASWVDWVTSEAPHSQWQTVRRLEREGVLEIVQSSNYLTGLALSLPGLEAPPETRWESGKEIKPVITSGAIVSTLSDDQVLLEKIWSMLADDQTMRLLTHRQPSLNWRTFRNDGERMLLQNLTNAAPARWSAGLIELCHDHRIDRAKLLQSTLELFVRFNLEHSESGSTLDVDWYTGLQDQLDPPLEERMKLLQDYLRLLSCRNPKVVIWALTKIEQVVEHPQFPVTSSCQSIANTFLLKGKEHSIQALKTLKKISDKCLNCNRDVAAALVEAMENESADVQKRAITLLAKLKYKDEDLAERMRSKLSRINILHRAEAADWAGISHANGEELNEPGTRAKIDRQVDDDEPTTSIVIQLRKRAPLQEIEPSNETSGNSSDLRERCKQIPSDLSSILKLEQALAILESTANDSQHCDLEALEFRGDEIPKLDPDKKLRRINDVDDLIFFLTAMLQINVEPETYSADDVETVLDAFARIGAERPDDFALRIQALRTVVEVAAGWSNDPIVLATCSWTTGKFAFRPKGSGPAGWNRSTPLHSFLSLRFEKVTRQFLEGRREGLLSTPTHQGGWIDALVLVERTAEAANRSSKQRKPVVSQLLNLVGLGHDTHEGDWQDQSLALLRLAPDNRAAALDAVRKLSRTEFVDALSYALGADNVPMGKKPELWIAAARARYPFCDDEKVEKHFPGFGPDAACVAKPKLIFLNQTPAKRDQHDAAVKFRLLDWIPSLPSGSKSDNLASVLMHRIDYTNDTSLFLSWRKTVTPLNLDRFFGDGIERISRHVGADYLGRLNRIYLESLYDQDVCLTRLGRIMLVLGLSSKQKDEHATAIEALIACIEDGRLTGTVLGATMYELHSASALRPAGPYGPFAPLVSMTRWAKALMPAARCSTYHAREVARCVEAFCIDDSAQASPRDLHLFLEILLSCLVEIDDAVRSQSVRDYLSKFTEEKTSTKTSKLAKQLLALKRGQKFASMRQEALCFAIERRVERGKRWAKWRSHSI